ncbi:MAG: 2-phosphosulfolactate phosphatase [Gemmatimonadota bacterium]
MKLDVFFTPGEVAGRAGMGRFVVVDVIRATSSMVAALDSGARSVFPVASVDDAARLAQNLGRDGVLLCGERKGLPIDGFDLGNSPGEFAAERVTGKALVMTTTNGTRALLAVSELPLPKNMPASGEAPAPRRILIGSFLNLDAVAATLATSDEPVSIVCAGKENRFAREDAVFAGALANRLLERADDVLERNDAAVAAMAMATRFGGSLLPLLRRTAAGQAIIEIGLEGDLDFCADVDRFDVVPEFEDRKITLP